MCLPIIGDIPSTGKLSNMLQSQHDTKSKNHRETNYWRKITPKDLFPHDENDSPVPLTWPDWANSLSNIVPRRCTTSSHGEKRCFGPASCSVRRQGELSVKWGLIISLISSIYEYDRQDLGLASIYTWGRLGESFSFDVNIWIIILKLWHLVLTDRKDFPHQTRKWGPLFFAILFFCFSISSPVPKRPLPLPMKKPCKGMEGIFASLI